LTRISLSLSRVPVSSSAFFSKERRKPVHCSRFVKQKERDTKVKTIACGRAESLTFSSSSFVHFSRLMFGFTRCRHRCAHCCPVRPGSDAATVAHLLPYFSCICCSFKSSAVVQGWWTCGCFVVSSSSSSSVWFRSPSSFPWDGAFFSWMPF
jgi:hypothetical protein